MENIINWEMIMKMLYYVVIGLGIILWIYLLYLQKKAENLLKSIEEDNKKLKEFTNNLDEIEKNIGKSREGDIKQTKLLNTLLDEYMKK